MKKLAIAAAIATTMSGGAHATDLNPGGEWQIRWDNTLKYSAGARVESANPVLKLRSPSSLLTLAAPLLAGTA